MTITQAIIALATSQAVIELIKYLIERHDKKKVSPERLMLKALGADRLYVLLCDWKHADVRPASEWETIDNLYTGYKALDGNGEITKLYNECKDIETTD
jgi:hypothetical protein